MFYLQCNLNFVQMPFFFSFKFQLVLSVYPVSSFPSHVLILSFKSSVILNMFYDVVSTRCFIPVLCHAWWLLMNNATRLINKSCTVKSSLWGNPQNLDWEHVPHSSSALALSGAPGNSASWRLFSVKFLNMGSLGSTNNIKQSLKHP